MRASGNVYVSWTKFSGAVRAPIQFSRSIDGGVTFSRPKTLSPRGFAANQGSSIAEDGSGNVYVVFENFNTSPHKFWLGRSTDNGASFSPVAAIQDVNDIPSPLTGASFRVFSFPQIAANRGPDPDVNGHLYLVWADNPADGDEADIMFIKSTDRGATWSTPVVVGDHGANAQFFPAISVSPDGTRIDLIYYSKVNITDATFNVYYRKGTINQGTGEVAWAPALPGTLVNAAGAIDGAVDFSGTFIGDYIAVASSDSKAYAVWTDTRGPDGVPNDPAPSDDNQDIFSAVITP